jgi:hypothetical protein
MIYINPTRIRFPRDWEERARELTRRLASKPLAERAAFIDSNREATWAHPELLETLRGVVGNKCWYSEVPLEGADPNVDHFRPKGRVVEVDCDTLNKTGIVSAGYWWLAFEPKNFRLACMHANQRRVDEETDGGKQDFFPVEGERAVEGTEWGLINENVLHFDPCSPTDMALMWFDPDGKPGLSEWRQKPTQQEIRRMKATIWLFHLDKKETARRRADHIEEIRTDLKSADIAYKLWNPNGDRPDLIAKNRFDAQINLIRAKITDNSPFAGAKRCAIHIAKSEYPWISEFSVA